MRRFFFFLFIILFSVFNSLCEPIDKSEHSSSSLDDDDSSKVNEISVDEFYVSADDVDGYCNVKESSDYESDTEELYKHEGVGELTNLNRFDVDVEAQLTEFAIKCTSTLLIECF